MVIYGIRLAYHGIRLTYGGIRQASGVVPIDRTIQHPSAWTVYSAPLILQQEQASMCHAATILLH